MEEETAVENESEEDNGRYTWKISTYTITGLSILINLILLLVLVVKKKHISGKTAIMTMSAADLLYGMCVLPFFVDNFVDNLWDLGLEYCRFFIFYFTFHDIFISLWLMTSCIFICLKYTGVGFLRYRGRTFQLMIWMTILCSSILLALPATVHSQLFQNGQEDFKQECRSLDVYTMPTIYMFTSSVLFCGTMGFLFSLCIFGSPFLKSVYTTEEFNIKWKTLLAVSMVNAIYIICAFLLNFKELSRFFYNCCSLERPFINLNNTTYDAWSFSLYGSKAFLRSFILLMYTFFY